MEKCKHCGKEVNKEDNFCGECGGKLNDTCPTCWRNNGKPSTCPGNKCP